MIKCEIVKISIAVVVFVGALSALILRNVITPAQAIEITILFALVLVTVIYAKRTSEIAKATEQQAEEMREQRYAESLPLLVPDITFVIRVDPNELDYELLQTGQGTKVVWHNAGKGAAINSRFSFYPVPTSSGKAEVFPSHGLGTLELGGKKEVDFDKIFERYNRETKLLDDKRWQQISNTYRPRLEAEYQDIYERNVTTIQEFRIDEQNKKLLLGELYFTVNGRRLGEDVTHHD